MPKGFVTDFASVPRIPIIFLLAGDSAHEAAVVHDFLYNDKGIERDVADAVFKEAMEASGIRWLQRNLMWAGVRVFGWKYRK